MKRGLVKLDHEETAPSVFDRRLGKLREKLRTTGSAAALFYADVAHSNGIDYLTNFCLYWNEAVLVVPVQGPPVLVMKLSKRVQPWIRQTSILDDIRSGPKMAQNVAVALAERFDGKKLVVGLNDRQWWPGSLLDEFESALPDVTFVDLPGAIRDQRRIPDREEAVLLQEAGALLCTVADAALQLHEDAAGVVEFMVRQARMAGFLDVDVECRTLADGSECMDVTAQFRYVWVKLSRMRKGPAAVLLQDLLDAVVAQVRPGVTDCELGRFVSARIGPERHSFACIRHADIETGGDYRAAGETAEPFLAGEVLCVVLTLYAGQEMARMATTFMVTADGVHMIAR